MDVRLSPEQQALRDSAARLVDRLGPRAVAHLDDVERTAKLDAAVAAAGWRELRSATETGAPWASAVEVALVAEELARGLADTAFLGPTLAAELRRLTGAAHPAGASHSDGAETVALGPGLSALADSADGALAVDGAGATAALVRAGDRLRVVALATRPVHLDLTRPCFGLDPSGRTGTVVGPLADEDVQRWTALGLALTCADLVGVMRGSVDLACDYARTRRQYGAAIGSFQAVQHLLADAFVAMEGSRSATLYAAWAVDELGARDALAAASVAKAYSARAARQVGETVVQVHGGMGNTWDCLAHVFLRRALLSIDILGGTGPNLARVLDHQGIGADHGLR